MTDRNGPSSPEDPFRICADAFRDVNQGVSDADELTGDIARDDALVESLAHRRPVPGEIDEVTALLADWCARTDRRDHLSVGSWLDQPAGATGSAGVPDVPAAGHVTAVGSPRPPGRPRRSRWLRDRRGAVAAAVVGAVLFTGMVGVQRAHPGGPLWPLVGLVDPGRVASVTASGQAEQALIRAEHSLTRRHLDAAEHDLAQARAVLPRVRERDGRARLAARLDTLRIRLDTARRGSGDDAVADPADPATSMPTSATTDGSSAAGPHGHRTTAPTDDGDPGGRADQADPGDQQDLGDQQDPREDEDGGEQDRPHDLADVADPGEAGDHKEDDNGTLWSDTGAVNRVGADQSPSRRHPPRGVEQPR